MLDFNNNQSCPIGLAAELIGDKWSIIILRDISVLNRQTYSQLYNKSLEGISSATLAKRLKRLLDIGMLTVSNDKLHSQKKIYSLTEAAIEFVPIIFDLAHWSNLQDVRGCRILLFLGQDDLDFGVPSFGSTRCRYCQVPAYRMA